MTAGCRFDVCRPPNAPRRKFPQPAPWFGAQSSGGEPPRGLRGPAEHAPRRRVIFVAVSPVTGHCRRLGAQKSLDQTNIVGRQQRSSGSLRRESKGASSRLGVLPAFGGFPNFSTNRSDASASDSYRPATDSIARRASSLRIAPAAFRASAARLRQYSGLRSGMAFSATPRATVRQVVLPPLGLLLLWIARRGCGRAAAAHCQTDLVISGDALVRHPHPPRSDARQYRELQRQTLAGSSSFQAHRAATPPAATRRTDASRCPASQPCCQAKGAGI